MTPKQDPKTEADKLVRDIKRATSAEIESSRTTNKSPTVATMRLSTSIPSLGFVRQDTRAVA